MLVLCIPSFRLNDCSHPEGHTLPQLLEEAIWNGLPYQW